MKYEKKSEILHDALNFLEEDMLNEVDSLRNGEAKITPIQRKVSWRKWAALAASVCVLIGGSLIYKDYILPKESVPNTEAGISREESNQTSGLVDEEIAEQKEKVEDLMQEGLFSGSGEDVGDSQSDGFVEHEEMATNESGKWREAIQRVIDCINNMKEALREVE